MAVFEYRIRDRAGKIVKSQMEADTVTQVSASLRSKGHTIVDITPARTGLQGDVKIPLLTDRPPGLKQVALFSKQMATLINSGVPLVQALAIMQRQIEHKAFLTLLKAVRKDVESGTPLSEAMQRYPKVFDRLYINLVRAGETSGTLDAIMGRISDFQEKDLALRGKIKSALTYPVIVLIFALGITYFLLTTIVPRLKYFRISDAKSLRRRAGREVATPSKVLFVPSGIR